MNIYKNCSKRDIIREIYNSAKALGSENDPAYSELQRQSKNVLMRTLMLLKGHEMIDLLRRDYEGC